MKNSTKRTGMVAQLLGRVCALSAVFILAGCEQKDIGEDLELSVMPAAPASITLARPLMRDEETGIEMGYRAGEKYLEVYNGSEFEPVYLNGVNMGSGVPGHFPGELAATKMEYLQWFQQISDMNCNTVRIYTTMMPAFYEAFAEYNSTAEKPLYLIMGVWYDEDTIAQTGDAYQILDQAVAEAKEQIDIIHGNGRIEERTGRAYGKYTTDVSAYVLGWILGIEPEATLVAGTNNAHPEVDSYEGTYLETKETDAFHAFMAEFGDKTIHYEVSKYGMMRPVSWVNWPTADALSHPEEPSFEKEDAVSLNVEYIHATEAFPAGVYASYHVYPYYPDFMYLSEKYNTYVDANGHVNTYEAYLQDLMSLHHIPVLVAEFGVPSSRGITHSNPYTGLDQGNLNETEQGWCLDSMARDIYNNGYAGGLVFTWQDEWFKRTWNTMDYTDESRRPMWNDVQTSEQHFGLLSFDAGEEDTVLVDGDCSEWKSGDELLTGGDVRLSVKQDEAYLYLCLQGEGLEPGADRLILPVDVLPGSGAMNYEGHPLSRGAEFVIDLRGTEDSAVLVQGYYDRYAFFYRTYDNTLDVTGYDDPAGEEFRPIWLSLNKQLTDPLTGEKMDATRYNTGALHYGCSDPAKEAYDSLADFCFGDHAVEVRIPWSILNFRDPSTKEAEGDFWKNGALHGLNVDEIALGMIREPGTATESGEPAGVEITADEGAEVQGMSAAEETVTMVPYTWENWDVPKFHERLKQGYDIMKECFGELQIVSQN